MISYYPPSKEKPYEKAIKGPFIVYGGNSVLALKAIMSTYTWSPIIWKNGMRGKENFIEAHYLGLDFENPDVSLESIIRSYCDTWHIIGTTRNHKLIKGSDPAMDRFRVLIPFTKVITSLDEYEYNLDYYTKKLGSDLSGSDGARMFFKCTDIVSVVNDNEAYAENVMDIPEGWSLKKKKDKFYASSENLIQNGIMPSYTRWALTNIIPQGKRSVACYVMGKELCRCGLSYEDALSRILASPTYKGIVIDLKTMRKIKSQLKGGYDEIEKMWGPREAPTF